MTKFRRTIGVIAEDDTDCDVVDVLVRRILPRECKIGVKRRRGQGCCRLIRKASIWMKELASDGCGSIILLHDLDRDPLTHALRDEYALRRALEGIAVPA